MLKFLVKSKMKRFNKKGQAGIEILTATVVTVFLIGFLITIFTLTGDELRESTADSFANASYRENITVSTLTTLTGTTQVDMNCGFTVNNINNESEAGALLDAANYTVTNCGISCTECSIYNKTWFVNGTLTGLVDSGASKIAANSTRALGEVPTWFKLILTITVMVVLILLTVMVIKGIRGTGLEQAGGA